MSDYEKAVEMGLTKVDRWSEGIDHHHMSTRIMEFLAKHDCIDYGGVFSWEMGGDGDNGEDLAYQLDAFFEMLDGTVRTHKNEPEKA